MTHNGGESVFQFINESDGRGPRDPATRKTIRRQAMSKTAAARRQQGKHGKTNLRQYPIFLGQSRSNPTLPVSDPKAPEGPHGKSDTATAKGGASSRPPEADFRGNHFSSSLLLSRTIPASLPSVGYESMRIQYDFDVLDLSALTSFHAGRATAHALMHDPSRLIDVLRCKQWSYLSFLPSRFGHVDCLDDAARCLAAKARHQLLSPTNPPNVIVVSLYSRALASLQSALSDPDRFLQPDVLCATEILAIYELLDNEGDRAWVRHIEGATSLIKLRGPTGYQTDFEKALFLAQAGPIFTEALLKGTSCFLEEESWQAVFWSAIIESSAFAERSSIVISLWMTICHIPRVFAEVETVICRSKEAESLVIEELMFRTRHLREMLVDWRRSYEAILLEHFNHTSMQAAIDKRYETLGVGLAMLIVLNRLISALNLDLGNELEDESQSLAHQLLDLESQAYASNARAGIFMALKVMVARATIATTTEWRVCTDPEDWNHSNLTRTASRDVFEHWCSLKGRKTTSYAHVLEQD